MEPWIETYTGKKVDVFSAKPEDISILDIAHALSMLCRFNGHLKRFLSVAEHCVATSRWCRSELALVGLLHDAAEAYLSDAPAPIKMLLGDFKGIDSYLTTVILKKFKLPPKIPQEIKELDRRLCVAEATDSGMDVKSWNDKRYPLSASALYKPFYWTPEEAESQFLNRFFELTKKEV
jgi:5'-deoxynucleotidase YfbR-like HD superfamily hydrolase